MTEIRPVASKGHAVLALEWDRLAEERHRQIESGEDISFHHVIAPSAWELLREADLAAVLEIGSGTGEFTSRLAAVACTVVAVEPSAASVAIARRTCVSARNVRFVEAALEDSVSILDRGSFSTAVAIMTLMTTPDIHAFAKALAHLLQNEARFVAMLTHPCFWPRYRGYEDESWFRYEVETFIQAPFVISKRRTGFSTTHIHRPLERYLEVFTNTGFRLDALVEPFPTPEIHALYPEPWRFPRFLGLRWRKVGGTERA